MPEFYQLISHEVVPGHVTTFAYLQNLYVRGLAGFEATVLTMNTRAAALFEGIANNAILIAHGATELDQLPDEDMQIGALLALLQDDAKNQSSFLTWGEGRPQAEVASVLRNEFLVSQERAEKLSGAWGRHPLLGRMYLPAYRAGTEKVAEWRRKYPAEKVLPVIYGCHAAGGCVHGGRSAWGDDIDQEVQVGNHAISQFWKARLESFCAGIRLYASSHRRPEIGLAPTFMKTRPCA